MRTDIDSALTTEMATGHFAPSTAVKVEPHLPTWSEVSQTGSPPDNPLGHAAIYVGGKLLRARSGSLADPNDNDLYFACIDGTDLDDPSTWESYWTAVGATNVAKPAYDGASVNPGQIAIAADDTGHIQIFYFSTSNYLCVAESLNWGQNWGITSNIVQVDNSALQVASCKLDECFFTDYVQVMAPTGPHTGVDANVIYRAENSGGWSVASDWPLKGRWYFMRSSRDTDVWGDPSWAGLGVAERPDGRVLVATGGLLLDALDKDGSQQGVFTFVCQRGGTPDDDLWWEGPTLSLADYDNEAWYFDLMVRASQVNGQIWLSWLYEDEPTDLRQNENWAVVPRRYEVVYARSLDGERFTEMESIVVGSNARTSGTGQIVLIGDRLYMVGWYEIYQANATHIVKDDAAQTDISHQVGDWSINVTGRSPDMTASLLILDPTTADINPGDLIKIEAGTETNGRVVVGRGYVDTVDPSLSVEQATYQGQVSTRTGKPLQDTVSRCVVDTLPQATMFITPDNSGQFSIQNGNWKVARNPGGWPVSAGLGSRNLIQINSGKDGGGDWHHTVYAVHPKMLNGSIQASVRMGLALNSTYGNSGDSSAYPSWPFTAYYTNGVCKRMVVDGGGPTFYNDYCAVGLVVRAWDKDRCYALVWEADTTWMDDNDDLNLTGNDRIDAGPSGYKGENRLVLYYFDKADSERYREVLDYLVPSGLTPGDIMDMRISVNYGKAVFWYKTHTVTNWTKAFEVDDNAAFGAGRFGFYGRGFLWSTMRTGQYDVMMNQSWIWDVEIADHGKNHTLEEIVKDYAWLAGIEVETEDKISGLPDGGVGTLYSSVGAMNPVIDAEVTLSAEAGFLLRATDTDNCVRLGIVPGSVGTGKLVLRVREGGATTETVAVPAWFDIPSGVSLPVRVTVQDYWYSVWIGDLLLGTIHHTYQNSSGIGLYGSGTFANVRMPELFEVPAVATLDPNQSVLDAINQLLGQRRIKRFMSHDGKMKLGYFATRDDAGSADNTMIRNTLRLTDHYVSHCRVQGALGYAEYKSPTLLARGRRFTEVHMPDIFSREQMYIEARAIVENSGQLMRQSNFSGYPNLALEPEDQLGVIVTLQSINGDYIIDDISLVWSNMELLQTIGTRQLYVE